MNDFFKNDSFYNYILLKLNKKELEKNDLDMIEEISIKSDKKIKFEIRDLEKFKNLKSLTLQEFKINNYETNTINRCKKIESLQFINCKFNSKSRLLSNNIKTLVIDNCKNLKYKYFTKLEKMTNLKIYNIRKVDSRRISKLAYLEKLTLNNTKVKNSIYLKNLNRLSILNLKGSKYNKILIELLKNKLQIER